MAGGGVATPTDPIDMVQYPFEEIHAAVQEARSRRTYAFAHSYVPEAITQAVEAGVRSIEHGNLLDREVGSGTDLIGEIHPAQSRELVHRSKVQSPLEVLRSATLVNAELLGRPGELGVVAPGAYADLLLVDGDPLTDLEILTRHEEAMRLVIRGGEIIVNGLVR